MFGIAPEFRPISATRLSFWSHHSFYLWVRDDSLCGSLSRVSSSSAVGLPIELLPLPFEGGIFGLALLVLLIPVAIIAAVIAGRKQKALKKRIESLDPASDEYLAWNKNNFRVALGNVRKAEFFEPLVFLAGGPLPQHLRLHFQDGESWHFTLGDRQESETLQSQLESSGVSITRRESQGFGSYLSQKLNRV